MDTSRENQNWLGLLLGDVGTILRRQRLLTTFLRMRPSAVLLSAPSGYGKTTLAAQFATSADFVHRIWVKIEDSEPSSLRLLLALHHELERLTGIESGPLAKNLREQELLHEVLATISALGSRICVVIDDLGQLDNGEVVSSLARGLRRVTPGSCLIVTTRQPAPLDESLAADSLWTIDAQLLRFTADESRTYLEALSAGSLDAETIEYLHSVADGQVALLSVLARHAMSAGTISWHSSPDAHQCFTKLVRTHCNSAEQDCLYAAALLQSGQIAELVEVLGTSAANDFRNASRDLPLVNVVESGAATVGQFVVHDIAESILTSKEFEDYLGPSAISIYRATLEVLYSERKYDRLFGLLLSRGEPRQLTAWLERVGEELALQCSTRLLARCLEVIPATLALTRPRLLLLQAHLMRMTDLLNEAERKARVALQLSRDLDDAQIEHRATLLLATISFDLGDYARTRDYLTSFLDHVQENDSDDLAVLYSQLAGCSLCLGEFERAAFETKQIESAAGESASRVARGLSLKAQGLLQGFVLGDVASAIPIYSAAMKIEEIGMREQLILRGNMGTALCEMGRLKRAKTVLADVLAQSERLDLAYLTHGFSGSLAGVQAADGSYELATDVIDRAIRGSDELGCVFDVVMNSAFAGTILRAWGRFDESLVRAETALERSSEVCFLPGEWLASIELAASHLAIGDEAIPLARVADIQSNPAAHACQHIQLRAAMLGAEIQRRHGKAGAAAKEISGFVTYIRSESPNWLCAMYVRAFPGLLGLLAKGVGPAHLPVHLLRMIMPADIDVALPMASDLLSTDEFRALAERLGRPDLVGHGGDPAPEPECHIRMFGGFEVRTSSGVVAQRAWKKRKARLLFAMLAVRQGKDVPREQLLEYLWPEMDEERARNNMYVVWNAMKTALAPAAGSGGARPVLAENAGGVCRINPRQVRSDLDDFADALHAAREAETAGDVLLAAGYYEQLRDIYRGELLPGDIYDDWFAPIREKYRHEFGDAMARCAVLLEQEDPPRGLGFVRAALSFDPWREDLYQLTLRLQICTGQRSAAIETYLACRTRLAEDLGLDPSIETRRLYDQVLAMEDPACGPRDAA